MGIYIGSKKEIIKIFFAIVILGFGSAIHAEFYNESAEAIEERIAPIGKVRIALETTEQAEQAFVKTQTIRNHLGKALFESHCILCHGDGIAGAPRFRNKTDWKPRIKKGLIVLLKHVKNGYRAMPPKGACLECSSEDLEAAINYIVKSSSY